MEKKGAETVFLLSANYITGAIFPVRTLFVD